MMPTVPSAPQPKDSHSHAIRSSRVVSRRSRLSALPLIAISLLTAGVEVALAQVPPPPLPPSEEESDALDSASAETTDNELRESERAASTEVDEPSVESDEAIAEPAAAAGASIDGSLAADETAENADAFYSGEEPILDDQDDWNNEDPDVEEWVHTDATRRQPALNGSTGLFHTKEAGSGPVGTFRMQVMGGYFSGRRFLCNTGFPCFDPVTGEPSVRDKAQRYNANVSLSVTPFPFLEAFATVKNSATYNSEATPQSLQIVGDTSLGVKGFLPAENDRIFNVGAEADLYLLSGTGGLGVAGGATSVAFRALGTLDLNNRSNSSDRIPLRAHLNVGYFFDNSGRLVSDLEETEPPEGRGGRITRAERYGLGISRVDSFEIALGAEYVHPYFRPFLEWSLDIPVNRQKYECLITDPVNDRTENTDQCLKLASGLATTPNRLSLGTRIYPWQSTGLALTLGADIGTGAVKRFIDEGRPESPYTIWFGVGYTVDVLSSREATEVAQVEAVPTPVAETRRYIVGRVVDEVSGESVADAIVRYQGVPMTGLVANQDGQFISQDLPAGDYSFAVTAKNYTDGLCSVTIPEEAPTAASSVEETSSAEPVEGVEEVEEATVASNTAPYADEDGNVLVPVDCKLTELPRVANVTGLLVDGLSGGPVLDGTVTIVDKLQRSLSLDVDSAGAFQFRNVPFGGARLRATAPGYLPTVHPINIAARDEVKPHILMNPRPKTLGVTFNKNEIKLARKIEFVGESTDLVLDSAAMIEELAVALTEKPDIGTVEIQVHTDDSGAASYARRISQERADYIKALLVDLGVLPRVLTAKGYGPDQPLAPNVTDESRAKNERVQFVITKAQ